MEKATDEMIVDAIGEETEEDPFATDGDGESEHEYEKVKRKVKK